jgi:hypothetical protein
MIKRRLILIGLISCVLSSYAQETGLVGTFYGGWGRNKGNYIWTSGLGENADFIRMADVDGDGYEDAVTISKGSWEVALSKEEENFAGNIFRKFGEHQEWINSFGENASNVFLADINNDQKADAIAFYAEKNSRQGIWEIAISSGHSFQNVSEVIDGFGTESEDQFFADVDGNGYPDAIIFEASDGSWHVRTNDGSEYSSESSFAVGIGDADSEVMMADINADQKMDIISCENGVVKVAKSLGTSFTNPVIWKTGFTGDRILSADVNGDKKADMIAFTFSDGKWIFLPSNGVNAFGAETFWCTRHGGNNPRANKDIPPGTHFMTGFVQTTSEQEYGVSPIVFNQTRGRFQVMPPYGMFSNNKFQPGNGSNWYNSYQAGQADQFLPFIDGEYYGFDAEDDTFAIRYLIQQLAEAKIDYVLFDQTNGWNALKTTYTLFAREIKNWNQIPGNRLLKYAICGKFKNTASEVEVSAKSTFLEFLSNPEFGASEYYQYWKGKPLFVCYGGVDNKPDVWEAYTGDKTYGNKFTLRWMSGNIGDNDPGLWYGWISDGALISKQQMVVQPGHYNGNLFHSRYYNGIEADFYRVMHWDKVLRTAPESVTIIGFTGDVEQVNVYITKADQAQDMGKTETWEEDDMYWKMTKNYIENYRGIISGTIQHVAEYGKVNATSATLNIEFPLAFNEIPAVYAVIEGNISESNKQIMITSTTKSGFTVNYQNGFDNSDVINWMAVKPGKWMINDSLMIQAGRMDILAESGSVQENFEITFQSSPALFSNMNSKNNTEYVSTKQININTQGFEIQAITESVSDLKQSEIAGWIAIDNNAYEMWSGRFCGTRILSNQTAQQNLNLTINEEFYDKTLLLAKSNHGSDNNVGDLIISSTTDSSAVINYQEPVFANTDSLNLIYFDGAGGSLFGSQFLGARTIDNGINSDRLQIIPNPAADQFSLLWTDGLSQKPAFLEILDMNGKTLYSNSYKSGQNIIINNILSAGNYIIRLTESDQIMLGRLIIVK